MATAHITHPLVRHGTHQRERLSELLTSGALQLDERSLADLVAFVAKFAQYVRFYPTPSDEFNGKLNSVTGLDWSGFWDKDVTVLLASIAATDVNSFRTQYRDNELAYYRAKKKVEQGKPLAEREPTLDESLTKLVTTIYDTAHQIAQLCTQIPPSHPLKAEVIRIITDKLKTPLHQLIEFHKGVANQSLAADYTLFIGKDKGTCQEAWDMATIDDFFCIDVRPPQDIDLDTLWRLFLTFANALAVVVGKAGKAFQYALHSRSDHPPHVTLMLSFLNLFRYLQNDLNALPDKHLFYYYHDVLRLALRAATPDRAYVVFTIAQNIEQYLLKKGTLFLGGKDRLGLDRLYALENELVINQAKLVDQKNLLLYINSPAIPIATSVADWQAIINEPFTDDKSWEMFGPKAFYRELGQKLTRLHVGNGETTKTPIDAATQRLTDQLAKQKQALEVRPGLLIVSPELIMEKSDMRRISVKFDVDISQLPLSIQLSTETDLKSITNVLTDTDSIGQLNAFIDTDQTIPPELEEGAIAPVKPKLPANDLLTAAGPSYSIDKDTVTIYLPKSFPAVKSYTGKEDTLLADIHCPFVRIQPASPTDYDQFLEVTVNTVSVQTASRNIRNLTLQLGDSLFASTAEIPLIGASKDIFTSLFATAPDLSAKIISGDQVTLSLPESLTSQISSTTFQVSTLQVLISGQWQEATKDKLTVPHYKPESSVSDQRPNATQDKDKLTIPYYEPRDSMRPTYTTDSLLTFVKENITIFGPASKQPINLFKIPPDTITISYASKGTSFPNQPSLKQKPIQLYHYLPFGGYKPIKAGPFTLAPPVVQPLTDAVVESALSVSSSPAVTPATAGDETAHGNMYLGFEKLVPGQTLSLLFQLAEGTGDPDFVAPIVRWSYSRNNDWVGFPLAFILLDETEGLQQTGLIQFQLPTDINNGNTFIVGGKTGEPPKTDLFWLRASATEGVNAEGEADEKALIDAFPHLLGIYPQAGSVAFENHGNSLEHLTNGIPANTIAQLRFRDVNVREVVQPYPSFGGRMPEGDDRAAYYRRISERLRHRQRAVTVWDYERLVLEQFPKLAIVKCLSHTGDDDVTRAGQVTVAVVPYPATMVGNRRFYPSVEAGRLTVIETYLNRYNSFFVSGKGSTTTCSCQHDETTDTDEPCGCQPASTLQVRNAIFEPVRLNICVRFRPGKDPMFYRNELNKALRNFLAPWASDATRPILFGTSISTTQLLRFLEMTDYVDVVTRLDVIHYPNQKAAQTDTQAEVITFPDEIVPFTPRSVLTTYLNSLEKDNPNAIDHLINYFEEDGCHCSGCIEKAIRTWITDQLATLKQSDLPALTSFKNQLGTFMKNLAEQGDLVGKIPDLTAMPADAVPGDAFWFKVDNTVTPPIVTVKFVTSPGAAFATLVVISKPIPA